MLNSVVNWLNLNAGAVQAVSTVALLLVTSWYAWRTHIATSVAERQLARLVEGDRPRAQAKIESPMDPKLRFGMRDALTGVLVNTGRSPIHVLPPKLWLRMQKDRGHRVYTMCEPLCAEKRGSFPRKIEPGAALSISVGAALLTDAREDCMDDLGYMRVKIVWMDTLGNEFVEESTIIAGPPRDPRVRPASAPNDTWRA